MDTFNGNQIFVLQDNQSPFLFKFLKRKHGHCDYYRQYIAAKILTTSKVCPFPLQQIFQIQNETFQYGTIFRQSKNSVRYQV